MKKTMAMLLSIALLLACFSISSAAEPKTDLTKESEAIRALDVPLLRPSTTLQDQCVVQGEKAALHFTLDAPGGAGFTYTVQVERRAEEGDTAPVASWTGDVPESPGLSALRFEWDTSGLPCGSYSVKYFAGKNGALVGSVNSAAGLAIVDKAIPLESIEMTNTRYSMQVGDQTGFPMLATPYNHTNSRDITVTSSNNDAAYAYEEGGYIYVEKRTAESAVITVSMGGKSCTFEVYTPDGGITLDRESATLLLGEEAMLTATLQPPVTAGEVEWSSSDPSIVSVQNGLMKAHKLGTATIRASVQGYTAWCAVSVNPKNPITSISYLRTDYGVPHNTEVQLNPTITPADSDSTISWESTNTAVVTVDENGLVKAVGPGMAAVTATAYGNTVWADVFFYVGACSQSQFTDMPDENHWAHAGLDYAVYYELLNGTSSTTLSPDMVMSRAMLVTVLWRAEMSLSGGENPFSDVPAGAYYTEAVAWANTNNIVNGVGGGKFDPNGNITREQLATILFRYAAYREDSSAVQADLSAFPDAGKVSPWAREAMQWAVAKGLITGTANNGVTYLDPQGSATRAQVATILMRYYKT
ncbi:MAG: S-layer homology domain-containing protein [Oscillospiraceae bacterium]|jgi:hypothetical protein|nr:S-layer homology domain-containing protein [Oscillospiraceae bacterium]